MEGVISMEENKKTYSPEIEKREAMIEMYIKRKAIIRNKYPKIYAETTPESIQAEYKALNTLVDSLQTSRQETWGNMISSDGCAIDGFIAKKYEDALNKFSQFNQENAIYITREEEENFKFPEIDFEGLEAKIGEVKTYNEWRAVKSLLVNIQQQPLPEDVTKKLWELSDKLSMTKTIAEEPKEMENETPALVNESKFSEIYGKAKGRVQQVFAKIKSFFKQQSQDQNNQEQDFEERD